MTLRLTPYVTLLLLCAAVTVTRADDLRQDVEHDTATTVVHRERFKGYGRFRPHFSAVCQRLDLDKRRSDFLGILRSLEMVLPACQECVTFFRSLYSTCRGARPGIPRLMGKRPPPADARPERDPHASVVDGFSLLSIALADDPKIAELTAPSVAALVSSMRGEGPQTPGAKDYFRSLASYIEAPFAGIKPAEQSEASTRHESAPVSAEEREAILNELF